MGLLELKFQIEETRDCPLYQKGDVFSLSGNAIEPPARKSTCLFLARSITDIVLEQLDSSDKDPSTIVKEFNCSGCSGLIKLIPYEKEQYHTPHMRMLAKLEKNKQLKNKVGSMESLLKTFSFFKALDENSLKDIISCTVMKDFKQGDVILRRGTPGKNLYIIIAGRVTILDDQENDLATLGRGEIFGEMSLFSGKPVTATITAIDPVKLLMLNSKDVSAILLKYPHLQMAFTHILVQRLSDANEALSGEGTAGMTGNMTEIPPAELLQMMHENMRTGYIEFKLTHCTASVVFIEGEIVGAAIEDLEGIEAFYEILTHKEGRFKYSSCLPLAEMSRKPLGGFMKLLMEGLRRIDEDSDKTTGQDSEIYAAEA